MLLVAPTGAGKTLAGFLPSLVELSPRRAAERPDAADAGLHTLYISPLKALAVDVARNLETPVARDGAADPRRDPDGRHAARTSASARSSARPTS